MTDSIAYLIVWVFVALGCLYAIYTIAPPKRLITAIIMIVASIAAPVYLAKPINDALGFAVAGHEISQEELLHYTVDSTQTWIYLWVSDEVGEPRSHKIPYTKEDEKKLAEAQQEGQEGVPQGVSYDPNEIGTVLEPQPTIETEPLPSSGGDK